MLLYLVDHRPRAVGKQPLFEAVWNENYVTDNVLTRMVMEIRQVIGDDADSLRYVQAGWLILR
jgi:DNA-binding winged helix-turn-helix (wHTH) protein